MRKELTKEERSKIASELGRIGGRSNVRKHGKDHMSELGKRGMASRWGTESRNKNGKRTKPKRKK